MVLLVLLLIAFFIFLVTRQSDEFRITRQLLIHAPAEKIFPLVNTPRNWEAWSPWADLDPNAVMGYDGPASGVGASMSWDGNNNVGKGRNTVVEEMPNQMIRFRLDFEKPMKGTNTGEFLFTPVGADTMVSWTMYGPATLVSKVMGLVMNCHEMCGKQFDKGLVKLKSVAEKA